MPITLRDAIDGDLKENYITFSEQRSEQNPYEVLCGTCAKVFYTDGESSSKISSAIEHGLDNPFLCDDCRSEYEELADEGR